MYLLLPTCLLYGQVGGTAIYQFLTLPGSAKIASMGGKVISLFEEDLSMTSQNPALLNKSMHHQVVLNYTDYFIDINHGYFSYGISNSEFGNFAAGIQYINYGKFTGTDETGEITGSFGASEYALTFIWSKSLDSTLSFGVTLKPIASYLERYQSYGFVSDWGINYYNRHKLFSASLVLRNLGTQLSTYNKHNREPLPFEILLGLSHRLQHAPFRFSITAHQLQKPDLNYKTEKDISQQELYFSKPDTSPNRLNAFYDVADKSMRHLIFGVEIIPIKNFYLSLGYNYQRRQELKIPERVSTVGFSWGFGLRVYKFIVSYGRATYHVAGSTNHFSLTTNISDFFMQQKNNNTLP